MDKATLVIGPNWVGDMVMAQGLLAALKRQSPHAAIDVVAPAFLLPLVRRMPQVREALEGPGQHGDFALAARFRLGVALRGRHAAAYVLPGSWKSALVPVIAAIPRRYGYLRELRWGLLNAPRPTPAGRRRQTAILYQALADPAVLVDPTRLIAPALDIDLANRDRLLRLHGLEPGGFVAFAPGAAFGGAKRWPADHWARLATLLRENGKTVVLFGSAAERQDGLLTMAAGPHVVDLIGETGLEDAVDLLSAAQLVIANDTGLLHVAAAVGARVLAIYGPTSPDDTPPLTGRGESLSLRLACSPCHARNCPLGHHDCLRTLSPQMVLARARPHLAR